MLSDRQRHLAAENVGLARAIAIEFARARGVPFDDMISIACEALCGAAARYDPDRGVPFSHYAALRVHGALADHVRQWVGRNPASRDARHRVLHTLSLDLTVTSDDDCDLTIADTIADPHDPYEHLHQDVWDLVDELPPRQAAAIRLCFEQDMLLREAGEVLGVTEARVSQLHHEAFSRLRPQLAAA